MQQRPQSERDENSSEVSRAVRLLTLLVGVLIHATVLAIPLFYAPALIAYLATSPPLVYAAFGIFALFMGSIPAVMLLSAPFKRHLGISVLESSIIAAIASVTTMQFKALERLTAIEESLGFGTEPSMFIDIVTVPNPYILFAVLLISFNLPFLYAYTWRSDTDWRYLTLYSIPVVIYGVLVIMFGELLPGVIQ